MARVVAGGGTIALRSRGIAFSGATEVLLLVRVLLERDGASLEP